MNLISAVGHGTTAELYLPLATGIVKSNTGAGELIEPSAGVSSLKILAVDDDPLTLMNMVVMLEDLGHDVTEATSGRSALEIYTANDDWDLVVTDHSMPGMTGSELARQLRQVRPDLPIVLASGYTDLPPLVTCRNWSV